LGERHLLADHRRSTAALARRFGAEFQAGDLTGALGRFHDVGKAAPIWQAGLVRDESVGARVGLDHKEPLRPVAGSCGWAGGAGRPGAPRRLDRIPALQEVMSTPLSVEQAAAQDATLGDPAFAGHAGAPTLSVVSATEGDRKLRTWRSLDGPHH
jgi:hypothetical protein